MLSNHISKKIVDKMGLEPTKDQQQLINMLSEYIIHSTPSEIFIINGYAGTGKTTVISALTAVLKMTAQKSFMLAPTGRAAKVISSYAKDGAVTIHKKIYRQKSSTDNYFVLDHNKDRRAYYIVDEASMINDGVNAENSIFGSGNLLEDLMQYVDSGVDCRLIIVGDNAQLPPIGSQLSPALNPNHMSRFGNVVYMELSDVVRQAKDSGILTNATICREVIERNNPTIPKFKINNKDVFRITGADFVEELESCHYKYGKENCIVITRSNKQANRFNQGIRNTVLCQEEEITGGDWIMVVKNNYAYASPKEDEMGVAKSKPDDSDFIANGDIAQIRRVRKYEEIHGLRFATATLWLGGDEEQEIECKIILNTLNSESPALSYDDSKRLFESVEEDYLHIKRKAARYKEMKKDPYLNALQIKFAYAVTCHKAQGGQWDAVFVDRMLWGDEMMTTDLLRWLYTAITRAKQRLYFVNFDDRFFDK